MSVVHEPILVETRLLEIFNYLPTMKMNDSDTEEFQVTFRCGSPKDLSAFLKSRENQGSPYPLIWLLYPLNEKHTKTEVILENAVFILAVNNSSNMLVEQRLRETFTKILMPLYGNVKKCLTRANISNLTEEISITKFPNYSGEPNNNQHFTTDIWDALKVVLTVRINNVCLKTIKL